MRSRRAIRSPQPPGTDRFDGERPLGLPARGWLPVSEFPVRPSSRGSRAVHDGLGRRLLSYSRALPSLAERRRFKKAVHAYHAAVGAVEFWKKTIREVKDATGFSTLRSAGKIWGIYIQVLTRTYIGDALNPGPYPPNTYLIKEGRGLGGRENGGTTYWTTAERGISVLVGTEAQATDEEIKLLARTPCPNTTGAKELRIVSRSQYAAEVRYIKSRARRS